MTAVLGRRTAKVGVTSVSRLALGGGLAIESVGNVRPRIDSGVGTRYKTDLNDQTGTSGISGTYKETLIGEGCPKDIPITTDVRVFMRLGGPSFDSVPVILTARKALEAGT